MLKDVFLNKISYINSIAIAEGQVDPQFSKNDELLEKAVGVAVVLTHIDLGAETEVEFPVVPETVGEYGVLLEGGGGDDTAVGSVGFLDDGDGLVVFRALNFLCKSCRSQKGDRCDHEK